MPPVLPRPANKTDTTTVYHGDCRRVLRGLGKASVDCVITDPPYPHIKRPYGMWTEEEWFAMMRIVVPECMRVVKPTGSAVFILQPNSEKVGKMRTWLWDFMSWVGKDWGVIQDAYWWNTAAMPDAFSNQGKLMRPSVKFCAWVGPPDCHRNQLEVLWDTALTSVARLASDRFVRTKNPSGHSRNGGCIRDTIAARGGVSPFNVLPCGNNDRRNKHPSSTPMTVTRWWVRYICPSGGTVLDPFLGSGTTVVAAHEEGRKCIGIEAKEEYVDICRNRINQLK